MGKHFVLLVVAIVMATLTCVGAPTAHPLHHCAHYNGAIATIEWF